VIGPPSRTTPAGGRVTDYDLIADRFDKRYQLYEYAGVIRS
jgi:hypothetical protein